MGYYSLPIRVIELFDQKKPDIDLVNLLSKTRDEVQQTVAVWGDNPVKDMELAWQNKCRGILSNYGAPSQEQIDGIVSFGSKKAVHRNVVKTRPKAVENTRAKMGDLLFEVDNPMQVLDHPGFAHVKPA